MMSYQIISTASAATLVAALLLVIATLGDVGQGHLYEDDEIDTSPSESQKNYVYRRFKATLSGGSPSDMDPSANVVRQNGEQRRSRLYIGKRPRMFQFDGLADENTSDNDDGPLLELLRLQESQGEKLKRAWPSSVRVKRSSSGLMHVQASVNSVDKTRSRENGDDMN